MKILSSFILVFTVLFTSSFPILSRTPALLSPSTTIIFYDDFEDTQANTYPSANGWWTKYSGASGYVTTSQSHSGYKSFRLQAKNNYSRYDLRNIPSFDYIRYEVSVRLEGATGKVRIGLNNPSIGEWTTSYAWVEFDNTGNITADGMVLQTYQADQWYNIKVETNFDTGKMNVYIDDVLVGQGLSTGPKDWTAFLLGVGHTTVPAYFDDVKITKLDKPPDNTENPPPSLQPPGGYIIFEDGFENTVFETYPASSGWWNKYSGASGYVTTSQSDGGRKSFRLQAKSNYARYDLRNLPEFNYVRYEVSVRLESPAGEVRIGLNNPNVGEWTTSYAYVDFENTGSITADGLFLQTYQANQWYHIKVEVNFITEKMNVYVNDILVGQELSTGPKNFTAFLLGVGHTTVPAYFDDVKVISLYCPPGTICDEITYLPVILR